MAAAAQFQRVRDGVSCPICLELYSDPVSIECGHNFCRSCITRCWEGPGSDRSCPQCRAGSREGTLRPNRELRNIVDMSRLNVPPENPRDEHLCPKHQQRLQLFCAEDHTLLCVICRESRDHKAHTVYPIEEAAQEHKKTFSIHKKKLSEEMEELQLWTAEESSTASALEENYKNQTEKIISTFELLKEFLDKEKQQLLNKLKKEHEQNMKKTQENLNELEISQSTHKGLITDLEDKFQQEDVDMLKDVKKILRRCDEVKILKPKKDDIVEKTLQSIGEDASLQEKLLELKATFPAELEWKYVKGFACEKK
ncbi:E3 ubiquitin-protein ligase TRIM39-like [Lissotriton helveticus]